MRVVLDIPVLVSTAVSTKVVSWKTLFCWQESEFDVVVSEAILAELDRVLHYRRIRERCDLSEELVGPFLTSLRRAAILVQPEEVQAIESDPSLNHYLACAIAGRATYIITGDRHLLDLGQYRGVRILDRRAFLLTVGLNPDA